MGTLKDFSDTGILLVDDNEDFLRGAVSYLRSKGLKNLRTAKNGVEGLAIDQEFQPKVILLDIYMPEIDGFEVIERLKDIGRDVKVILFSSENDAATGIRTINVGASDFIPKANFFEVAEIKLLNTLKFGKSINASEKALVASIFSNLDLLEEVLKDSSELGDVQDQIQRIKSALDRKNPDKEEISESVEILQGVAVGASGNLMANGILEIISALSGLI